jgi:hypothetical protein
MLKRTIQAILPLLVVSSALVGCATTKRVLTNTLWSDQDKDHHVYLSYWEGTCRSKYLGGCSKGDSHVKFCSAQADNSLKCETVSELDVLLAR